jgi:hypothetical protein
LAVLREDLETGKSNTPLLDFVLKLHPQRFQVS